MANDTRSSRNLVIVLVAIILAGLTIALLTKSAPEPRVSVLVPGSVMHGVEGLALAEDGTLYGASYFGQAIYHIDPNTGKVDVAVRPPEGEGDDVAIGPVGTPVAGILAWTSAENIYVLRPGGKPEVLMANVSRANPIAFNKEGRLFFSQSGTADNELWELDALGRNPPRLVTKGQGPLNGFGFGPDGRLYAPLFNTDQAVAIDIDSGAYTVVAKGLGSPSAVKSDTIGNLFAVDYKKGDVWRIDGKSGAVKLLAALREPPDNFTFAADGSLSVANPADSSIVRINPDSGEVRDVVKGRFNTPLGMVMTTRAGKPSLLAAQPMGFVYIDPATGESDRPFWDNGRNGSQAVAADERIIVTTTGGRLRKFDRATDSVVLESRDVKAPGGVVIAGNGDIIVADTAGRIVKWTENGVTTVADGLSQPTALALESPNAVLVAETETGQITRIDLGTGQKTVFAKGLDHPLGVAKLSDGRIAVAEAAKGVIVAIDDKGRRSELATGLPLTTAGLRVSATTPTGLAVGTDGTLYVACPADNSVVKITFVK